MGPSKAGYQVQAAKVKAVGPGVTSCYTGAVVVLDSPPQKLCVDGDPVLLSHESNVIGIVIETEEAE